MAAWWARGLVAALDEPDIYAAAGIERVRQS